MALVSEGVLALLEKNLQLERQLALMNDRSRALLEGVIDLFPGADRQALTCLAELMAKDASEIERQLEDANVRVVALTNKLAQQALDLIDGKERFATAERQLADAKVEAANMRACYESSLQEVMMLKIERDCLAARI